MVAKAVLEIISELRPEGWEWVSHKDRESLSQAEINSKYKGPMEYQLSWTEYKRP